MPSAFVVLDAMPTGPTGKVDRKALPAPDLGRDGLSDGYVAPAGGREEALASIWEEVTGFSPVGADDDFFELGGNSLLAVQVASRVRDDFGTALPLEALLAAPTVARLARVLEDRARAEAQPLVIALRATGSKPPLFCLPGAGGHVFSYYDLARLGDPERPFFGLPLPEPGRGRPIPATIEGLAALYVPEVRKIQPEGPYHLGGYSFGGIVAYEIAQQLIAQGEEVALLALFDTWAKGYPRMLPWALRLPLHLRRMAAMRPAEMRSYLSGKVRSLACKAAGRARPAPSPRVEAAIAPVATTAEDVAAINHRAARAYEPRPYPGRLVVFRASQVPDWLGVRFDDPALGWGDLVARGAEVLHVPGAHLSLFDGPHVAALAEALRTCLP